MRQPSTKLLNDVFLYLHGIYDGRGDIMPLGKIHIDNIAAAVKYISEKIADEEVRNIEEREKDQ